MISNELKKQIEGVIIFGKPHFFGRKSRLSKKFALLPVSVASYQDGEISKTLWLSSYYQIDIVSELSNKMIPYILFPVKDLTHFV